MVIRIKPCVQEMLDDVEAAERGYNSSELIIFLRI